MSTSTRAAILLLSAAASAPLFAQEADTDNSGADAISEVTATGSRIAR